LKNLSIKTLSAEQLRALSDCKAFNWSYVREKAPRNIANYLYNQRHLEENTRNQLEGFNRVMNERLENLQKQFQEFVERMESELATFRNEQKELRAQDVELSRELATECSELRRELTKHRDESKTELKTQCDGLTSKLNTECAKQEKLAVQNDKSKKELGERVNMFSGLLSWGNWMGVLTCLVIFVRFILH
jgi:vacuolar-type H+-ATPase subunit I/STV1